MSHSRRTIAPIAILSLVTVTACSGDTAMAELQEETAAVSQDQRERDGDGGGDERGEESGTELLLTETYDQVRNGARLVLNYDADRNAFTGTVENTTTETLRLVRVEVHLSSGRELGPTEPADLAPGGSREVMLTATNRDFDGWTAHPEVGEGEPGGEGEGEPDRSEEAGEHDEGGERGEHDSPRQ